MGVAEPPPWATGVVRPPSGLMGADPPPGLMGVAGRPMWPKGVARPPQQYIYIFFQKKKILKIIYIDFI